MEIKKIRKMGDQKIITVPKKSNLQIGDFVMLTIIPDPQLEERQNQKSQEEYFNS